MRFVCQRFATCRKSLRNVRSKFARPQQRNYTVCCLREPMELARRIFRFLSAGKTRRVDRGGDNGDSLANNIEIWHGLVLCVGSCQMRGRLRLLTPTWDLNSKEQRQTVVQSRPREILIFTRIGSLFFTESPHSSRLARCY